MAKLKWTALRDTREQTGWRWNSSTASNGTETIKLDIADYTIKGFEDILLIERKASPSEIYTNIIGADWTRFKKELIRLNNIKHAYLIFEFTVDDLFRFPWNEPKIPKSSKYKMSSGESVFYRITKFSIDFPNINIIFAGNRGKDIATNIFKRMVNTYPELVPND